MDPRAKLPLGRWVVCASAGSFCQPVQFDDYCFGATDVCNGELASIAGAKHRNGLRGESCVINGLVNQRLNMLGKLVRNLGPELVFQGSARWPRVSQIDAYYRTLCKYFV